MTKASEDTAIRLAVAWAQVIRDWADRTLEQTNDPTWNGDTLRVYPDDIAYVRDRSDRIATVLAELHPAGDNLLVKDGFDT